MLEDGLFQSIKDSTPMYLTLPNGDKVVLWLDDVHIYKPTVPSNTIGVKTHKIYPSECRQRGTTYKGKIIVRLGWSINGKEQEALEKDLGEVPIMIKVKSRFDFLTIVEFSVLITLYSCILNKYFYLR